MSSFKKRHVSSARVAAVEAVSASVPIVGDPRMSPTELGPTDGVPIQIAQHANDYKVGGVYEVPLSLVKSNPFNPRAVYTSTAVDSMALSLSTSGQRISATGYLDERGGVILIEGETRLRGARAAGLSTLRIEIRPRPTSDQQLYEEARSANVERREQTPLDDAIKWTELLAKNIYPTQVSLAKALNLGEDYVSRTLSLAQLPTRLIHTLAEHADLLNLKMLNALREYWQVQGDDATLELIFEVVKNGMGYRDVLSRRKAAASGPVKRPRSTRESLNFKGAIGELKSFEEEGRVELSLKGLSPESALEITLKLKALFPKD